MDPTAACLRPDLDPPTRLLALAAAAIQPADWPAFSAAATAARDRGLPRAEWEEMLLQATLFFGFPRAVSAFEHLAHAWPAAAPPAGGDVAADERRTRGRALFAAIYAHNDAAVRQRLLSFHREFHDFVLEAAYGRILCRPGLSPPRRELLAVTALAAQQQLPQLLAHGRGALALGATRAAVGEALWCAVLDDDTAAGLLRRI